MSKISTPQTLRELKPNELELLFPLINGNNPSITRPLFKKRLAAMKKLGYRAIGMFEGKTLIACSGFWLRTRFWSGLELDIDNFYVAETHRSKKLGAAMLQWFEAFALKNKVDLIVLDTYADYFLAQRFYVRGGFAHTGYHMTKVPGSKMPFARKQAN
jgi:GNAT superfamily N-acetyltransferase